MSYNSSALPIDVHEIKSLGFVLMKQLFIMNIKRIGIHKKLLLIIKHKYKYDKLLVANVKSKTAAVMYASRHVDKSIILVNNETAVDWLLQITRTVMHILQCVVTTMKQLLSC